MTASLPSGSTPAITSSTPACLPMAAAVRWLSPVSMTTRMPMACSSRMARGLSSLMVSATAMMPSRRPAPPKNRGVLPCAERAAAFSCSCAGTVTLVPIKDALPPKISTPSSFAARPLPGRAAKPDTSGAVSFCSSVQASTAFASGCSLLRSSAAARVSSSVSETPSAGRMSVTFGSPLVMVPVLSSATIWVRPAASSEAAVLNRMPFFAPRPLPTMMATGVARPSAQGQLMTSTEMPRASA